VGVARIPQRRELVDERPRAREPAGERDVRGGRARRGREERRRDDLRQQPLRGLARPAEPQRRPEEEPQRGGVHVDVLDRAERLEHVVVAVAGKDLLRRHRDVQDDVGVADLGAERGVGEPRAHDAGAIGGQARPPPAGSPPPPPRPPPHPGGGPPPPPGPPTPSPPPPPPPAP